MWVVKGIVLEEWSCASKASSAYYSLKYNFDSIDFLNATDFHLFILLTQPFRSPLSRPSNNRKQSGLNNSSPFLDRLYTDLDKDKPVTRAWCRLFSLIQIVNATGQSSLGSSSPSHLVSRSLETSKILSLVAPRKYNVIKENVRYLRDIRVRSHVFNFACVCFCCVFVYFVCLYDWYFTADKAC